MPKFTVRLMALTVALVAVGNFYLIDPSHGFFLLGVAGLIAVVSIDMKQADQS